MEIEITKIELSISSLQYAFKFLTDEQIGKTLKVIVENSLGNSCDIEDPAVAMAAMAISSDSALNGMFDV